MLLETTFDFSGIQTALGGLVTDFLPAATVVLVSGIGIAAVSWGYPKLMGLFKKTAK